MIGAVRSNAGGVAMIWEVLWRRETRNRFFGTKTGQVDRGATEFGDAVGIRPVIATLR